MSIIRSAYTEADARLDPDIAAQPLGAMDLTSVSKAWRETP